MTTAIVPDAMKISQIATAQRKNALCCEADSAGEWNRGSILMMRAGFIRNGRLVAHVLNGPALAGPFVRRSPKPSCGNQLPREPGLLIWTAQRRPAFDAECTATEADGATNVRITAAGISRPGLRLLAL